MPFGCSVARLAILAGLAGLVAGTAEAQTQTSAQQLCINTLNKGGQKVATIQGKNNSKCIKDAGLSKLPSGIDITECLNGDLKGKVNNATLKTIELEGLKCTEAPDFGFTGSAVVNESGVNQEVQLAYDVFKTPLTSSISTNPAKAKCQSSVSKAYEKYMSTVLKEFNTCVKKGLKDESITSRPDLVTCVGQDPKFKIDTAEGKILLTIEKSCEGVTLSDTFKGKCKDQAATPADLSACLANTADCRACIAARDMDRIFPEINCDSFDDGVVNDSCEGCGNGIVDRREACDDGANNSDVTPDACRTNCVFAYCGDGVLDYDEECDDGNTTAGDGCDASCACEAGNLSPTCQDMACPSSGQVVLYAGTTGVSCVNNGDCEVGICNETLQRCQTETRLDTGWTGISHGSDVNDQVVVRNDLICSGPFAGGPEPCGECKVVGIDPSPGNCRCANDSRTKCDEPFEVDDDDCGGDVCNCYFGPPLPISTGNTPACVVNRFRQDIRGTANVDTGAGATSARLAAMAFLGELVLAPCPVCGGTCTGPAGSVGKVCGTDIDCDLPEKSGNGVCANFDPTPGDGNREGTCYLGANHGLDCDIDAYNQDFPADTVYGAGGGGSSLDCLPDPAKNVSASGLIINLDSTTGTSALPPAAVPCGFSFSPGVWTKVCPCGICSLDTRVACTSNTDCTGIGTCSPMGQGDPMPDQCPTGEVCNDVGGGMGECSAGSIQSCDGIARANGEGFLQCSNNAECYNLAGLAGGTCTLNRPKPCFLSLVSATGVADPNTPVTAAAFCVPPTAAPGINTVGGLPGPARVKNAMKAESYCASNPATPYTPGVGGCPP